MPIPSGIACISFKRFIYYDVLHPRWLVVQTVDCGNLDLRVCTALETSNNHSSCARGQLFMVQMVERGKPAAYGQEVVKRRARITASYVSLQNRQVLDFGSGNGAQTVELLKHGCQVVACDIDAADLGVLADFAAAKNIVSVKTVLYDGIRLPLGDAQFDVLVSYAVLEHVNDEATSLAEMHRVLKNSGELVISVPNKWWVFETHGARLPLLPWNRVPFFSWLPKSIHARFAMARIYTRRSIIRLLEDHAFEILGSCYMTAPMDVVKSPALQKFLRRVVFRNDVTGFPILATEIFVHCRKK
ncbi:MAG: class I SAM-dependent methyltransferase [Bacteroidetes bacterium]|nr:class I SAM-dependent methyltransferase [Bacteroidota bacterium]